MAIRVFFNHLHGEEIADCFAKVVFLVCCDCCAALIAVPRVYLQFVLVVFPDHTHLLFWGRKDRVRHVCICLRNYYGAIVALQS